MRLPYQVLIIPYKKSLEEFKFLILKRSDFGFWQWVSGGGETEDKDIIKTVVRELREEIDVSVDIERVIKLESKNTIFEDNPLKYKNKDITVIPEYAFGVEIKEDKISISKEHKEYRWVTKKEADKLLKYDSNKTALLELDKIIKNEVNGSWKINWEL